ncbi:ATP-dependent DNA helicase PIF1-like [Dendronephthya gigantea]|uniref:ATP-dependent DNA helicase PIF1-like n=1 Tax=Dendronephthya gigantea TaxID=151771 RepID=UPI00106CC361|nr:ATP-dependent DNA helicase PIF1-like [Dendronephthya gigantea]
MNQTVDLSSIKLTKEQQDVADLAELGHNVCIFGRAGVGKTTVVEEITKRLTANGIKVQVLSSSGISCMAYNCGAKTVHAHYGLQTAELPDSLLIERSLRRQNILENIENTNAVIWDEISMSSERIFSLVNLLQHTVLKNNHPFGGVQIILVGDFWQLKPIPGPFDLGKVIYSSELFEKAFKHRFKLTTIWRQGGEELKLKAALDQIRWDNAMMRQRNISKVYRKNLSRIALRRASCSYLFQEIACQRS